MRHEYAGEVCRDMDLKYNADGLIPVVTIDNKSGRVLMVAYMNSEAFEKTMETKRVHYYSRSRKALWLKGESSGHFQDVVSIHADCDADTLLVRVNQTGVACHTGEYSCFFNEIYDESKFSQSILFDEEDNIACRKRSPKAGSYTNYLFDNGVDKICKKIGEEASEVIISAKNGDAAELVGEACDLLFHLQVLLTNNGISLTDVLTKMTERRKKEGNLKQKNIKGEI